jgi:ABC-type lipoprotein release transport system permease subunit
MGAVALRARAELRSSLRSWSGLALLVGLVAGLVIAAAAGARRTDTVYERFLAHQRAADVFVDNYPDPGVGTVNPAAVERLPQVATSARAAFLFVAETGALAPADDRLGRDVNRLKVVDGRLPARDRVEEIAVGFARADEKGWRRGTTIPLIEPQYAAEAARAGVRNIGLRVVGIVAGPGDFPPLDVGSPSIHLTPAFYRAYRDTSLLTHGAGRAVIARLRRGAADVDAFRAGVNRLARGKPSAVTEQAHNAENVERSLGLQAAALWALAALVAATGVVIVGQALARQTFLDAYENDTLHALGMTRRQLWTVGELRAVAIGAAGAAIGVATAVALSPLTPFGTLARTAEPDPGVWLDGTALGAGAVATVLVTALIAAPAAWIATRGTPAQADEVPGAGRIAGALGRLGASTPLITGVRMALEPGRGRSAVPVRTAIVGVTVGVMAFAAALTFGASSAHLLDTPRLYGWNWDLALTNYSAGPDLGRGARPALMREPAIDELSTGSLGVPIEVEGRRVDGIALDPVRGSVLPPMIEGRAPAAGEIALGAKTLRTLGVEIGDTVTVRRGGARSARMRVVGKGVLASSFSSTARLGQGAIIRHREARRLAPGVPASEAVLRLAPGTDPRRLLRRLRGRLDGLYLLPMRKPLDIVDFGRVRALPLVLAGLLGVLAAATLAHVLATAARRRRRDLAVLKALGLVRRQVRAIVVVQALTYAAVAVLGGLPLGVAAGRFAWSVFAEWQGIAAEVVIPLPTILAVVPAAALVAAALALLPARWAAATPAATVLRSE